MTDSHAGDLAMTPKQIETLEAMLEGAFFAGGTAVLKAVNEKRLAEFDIESEASAWASRVVNDVLRHGAFWTRT